MMSNYKANPFSPALTPNHFIHQGWTYPSPYPPSQSHMCSPVFLQPGVSLPLSPHFKQYIPNAQCLSSTPDSLCSSEHSSPGVSKDSGPPFDFPSHSHLSSDRHSITLHHIPDYLKRGVADEELVLQKAVEGAAKNGVILEVPDSSLKIDFRFHIDSPEFIPKCFQPLVPCADTISDANSSKIAHKECFANKDHVVKTSHEESLGKFRQEASPLNRSEEIDSGIGLSPLAETICCYSTQTDHFEQATKETQTEVNILHRASQTQDRSDQEERNYSHVVGVAPLYNSSEINRTVCNLQMEICQLRASICLNELHRQLCQLKLDKYNWTTHFTPIKDQKSAGILSVFSNRYKCLLEETSRIETQLTECLEVLENGNVLKELPDFGIFMPDNTMFIPLVTRRPNYSTVEERNEIYSSSSGKQVHECKNFAEKTCKLPSNSPNQSTKCIPHASVGCQENVEMLLEVMDGQDNVSSQGTTNADIIKFPQNELNNNVHMAMISVSQMSLHDEDLNLEIDKPVDLMTHDSDTEKVAEISCYEPNNQIQKNTSYDQPVVEKNEHKVNKTDTFFDQPVIETESDQYQTETFDQLLLLEKDPYLKQNDMSSDHLGLGENEEFDEKRTLFDHCLPMESDCSQAGTYFEVPVPDKSSQHQMLTDFVIVRNDHLQRLQDISDAKDGKLKTQVISSLPETSSSENNETLDLNKSISSASLPHSNQITFNCNTLLSGFRSDNLKVNIDPQHSSLSSNKKKKILTSTCQEMNQENNLHVCKSTEGYLDKTELKIIKSTLSHTVNCSLEIYSEDGHDLMRNDFQEMTPSTLEKFDKMSLKLNKGNIESPKICQQQALVSSVESPEEPNHKSYEVSIGKQETDDVLDIPGREWDDKEFGENISSMSAIEPESDDDSQLVCLNIKQQCPKDSSMDKSPENSLNENCVSESNPINAPTTNIPIPSFSLVKETPSIVLDTSSTIETFGNETATKKPSSGKEHTSTLQSVTAPGEASQLSVHNLVTQLPCSEGNWMSTGVSQMSTPLISQRFSPVCHLQPESPSVKSVPLLQNEIEGDEIYQEVLKTLQESYPLFALDPDFLLKLAWEQTQILKLHLNSTNLPSSPIPTDVPAKMDTFGNQLIPDAVMKPSTADNFGVFNLTNFPTPLMDFGSTVTVPGQTSGVNLMSQDIVFGRNNTDNTAGKDHKMSTLTKSSITTSMVGNVLIEPLNADEISSNRASSLKSLHETYKTSANETFSREAKLLASKAEANATAPSTQYRNAPQPPFLVSGIAMQTSWSKWHDPPGLSKTQVPCQAPFMSSKNTVSDLDLTNTFSSTVPNSQTRLMPQPLKPLISIHSTVTQPAASASPTTTAPVSISHPSDFQDTLDKGCTKEPQSEDWMKVGKKGKTKPLKGNIQSLQNQQAVPGICDRGQLQKVQPTDPLSADKGGQPRKGKVKVSYTTDGEEKTEEKDCKKASPFQKLVRTLMKNFPSIKLEDMIKTVEEVKQQHGKFTGMMFSDIIQAAHRFILQKYGLRPKPQVSPVFTDMSVQAKEKMPPLVKNSSTPWHISSQQSGSSNVYDTRQLTSRECSICLANIVSKNRQQLDCGHTFHSVCISEWLSKHNRTCPNCRKLALMPDEFPRLSK